MATIKRRRIAPGVYELERGVSRGAGPDGKYRQKTRRFRGTAAEAKKARARLLAEVDAEAPADEPAAMTFRELLHRHIERVGTMGASPHTVTDYRAMARNHLEPVFGDVPIDQLRTLDFDAFYDDLTMYRGLRPASIRKIHNLARGALRQAVRWGLVPTNVVAAAAPPTIRRPEIKVPSPEEVQIVYESCPWERRPQKRLRIHRERAEGLARLAGGRMNEDTFVFASWRPGNAECVLGLPAGA